MKRMLLILLFAAAVAPGAPAHPAAASTVTQQPPASPQEGFVPVDDTAVGQEKMPAAPLVAAAYAVAWAAVLIYAWFLWRRLGAVERELKQLTSRFHQ